MQETELVGAAQILSRTLSSSPRRSDAEAEGSRLLESATSAGCVAEWRPSRVDGARHPPLAVATLAEREPVPIDLAGQWDLNGPPPNWLDVDERHGAHLSRPWAPHRSARELVDLCVDAREGGGLAPPDVVCAAGDLRGLLTAPYRPEGAAFVAHRIGPTVVLEGTSATAARVRDARNRALRSKLLYYAILAEAPRKAPAEEQEMENPTFCRVLRWSLADVNVLLGVETPLVVAPPSKEAMTLSCVDTEGSPMETFDALTAWLDGVLSNVNHAALCHHRDGVVEGIQMVPISDIPLLAQPPFEPVAILHHATNVLQWLKSACSKVGATYVLIKSKDSSELRLYELSEPPPRTTPANTSRQVLCDWADATDDTVAQIAGESALSLPIAKTDFSATFAEPMGVLCFRMARGLRVDSPEALRLWERCIASLSQSSTALSRRVVALSHVKVAAHFAARGGAGGDVFIHAMAAYRLLAECKADDVDDIAPDLDESIDLVASELLGHVETVVNECLSTLDVDLALRLRSVARQHSAVVKDPPSPAVVVILASIHAGVLHALITKASVEAKLSGRSLKDEAGVLRKALQEKIATSSDVVGMDMDVEPSEEWLELAEAQYRLIVDTSQNTEVVARVLRCLGSLQSVYGSELLRFNLEGSEQCFLIAAETFERAQGLGDSEAGPHAAAMRLNAAKLLVRRAKSAAESTPPRLREELSFLQRSAEVLDAASIREGPMDRPVVADAMRSAVSLLFFAASRHLASVAVLRDGENAEDVEETVHAKILTPLLRFVSTLRHASLVDAKDVGSMEWKAHRAYAQWHMAFSVEWDDANGAARSVERRRKSCHMAIAHLRRAVAVGTPIANPRDRPQEVLAVADAMGRLVVDQVACYKWLVSHIDDSAESPTSITVTEGGTAPPLDGVALAERAVTCMSDVVPWIRACEVAEVAPAVMPMLMRSSVTSLLMLLRVAQGSGGVRETLHRFIRRAAESPAEGLLAVSQFVSLWDDVGKDVFHNRRRLQR